MNFASNKYKKRLNSIKKGVIKCFNKGKASNWRNRDFEDLSFEIRKTSKVLISAATLKRIFGKNKTAETYYPQESTLEALENYAGLVPTSTSTKRIWIAASIGIALVFIGLIILFLLPFNKEEKAVAMTTFSLQKVEGNTPSTAFFNYNNPLEEDSVFISFDDGQPLKHIPSETSSISHVYNYPGLFKVALKTRKQIISDTLKVLVPTKGWQALASYYQQDFRSRYYPLPMNLASTNEGFHPTRKNLSSIGIDTTKILVVQLDNYNETQINGDSFTLKTRLKNINYWPAIRCYSAFIKLVGQDGLIMFKLTNKGCSGFGELTLSEKTEHGSNIDLSSLTLNIKNWNKIEIHNKQKDISLLLNDVKVFNDSYQNSIGNIVGISLQFHGSGYVDYFELFEKTNTPIISTNF